MSYARTDDRYRRLTEFCQHLSAEIQEHTGSEFPIFQDRISIRLGENWKQRIEASLDEVLFLIPILTPSFFQSEACRDELERFLSREAKLNRNDLILPIYYIDYPLFNDPTQRASDRLAETLSTHQYFDWRELRVEPYTSPQAWRMLAQLAVQVRDALGRVRGPSPAPGMAAGGAPRSRSGRRLAREADASSERVAQSVSELAQGRGGPAAKTEPPTVVVDAMGRGDYLTIAEAIQASSPGDRILVRAGLYREGLVIDKPLEIIGDGDRDEIEVQATGKDAVLFKTTMGRMANLTLRHMGGDSLYCVYITQGRLLLEDCDIASQGLACVGICGGADPRLRRNRIHDGKKIGVYVYENGQGTLEDNDIFGNAAAGVVIVEGGNPTLRRNRIHDGKDVGVNVYENGQGTLEDNDIFGNANEGVVIKGGANPTLRRNRINRNGSQAVWVRDKGGGTFEDNDLRENAHGAWDISVDSEALVKRARNQE